MADQGITWPSFNWEDPLLLEAALSEEERMVRDTVRAFAEENLAPIVLQANRLGATAFPTNSGLSATP